MRVFVSWSGSESRAVANILHHWLPNILQDVSVYVSAQDIASGERWAHSVNENLQDHNFGISIVTPTNVVAPWILFEAGAIAKKIGDSRLIPMLCGIDSISIANHPLAQFQWVKAPAEGELYKLANSLNSQRETPLPPDRLKQTFDKWYPDFVSEYDEIEFTNEAGGLAADSQSSASPLTSERLLPVLETIMKELRDLRAEVSQPIVGVPGQAARAKMTPAMRAVADALRMQHANSADHTHRKGGNVTVNFPDSSSDATKILQAAIDSVTEVI